MLCVWLNEFACYTCSASFISIAAFNMIFNYNLLSIIFNNIKKINTIIIINKKSNLIS